MGVGDAPREASSWYTPKRRGGSAIGRWREARQTALVRRQATGRLCGETDPSRWQAVVHPAAPGSALSPSPRLRQAIKMPTSSPRKPNTNQNLRLLGSVMTCS